MEPVRSPDHFNWFTWGKGNKGLPVSTFDSHENAFVIGSNNVVQDHDLFMSGGWFPSSLALVIVRKCNAKIMIANLN